MSTVMSNLVSVRDRHGGPATPALEYLRVLVVGDVKLNIDSMSVTVRGRTKPLSVKEFAVL